MPDLSLHRGKFLELRQRGTWEYVHRIRGQTPVGIAALTPDNKVLLISQFRVPLQKTIIEIPAGLVGDKPAGGGEEPEAWPLAAKRELLEETGWSAEKVEFLTEGPTSAGLTSECIILVRATGLIKRGPPTPDGDEQIEVHEIPLNEVDHWLAQKAHAGQLIDPKVYAALYFLTRPGGADAPVG